jgi:hypothetical protein
MDGTCNIENKIPDPGQKWNAIFKMGFAGCPLLPRQLNVAETIG